MFTQNTLMKSSNYSVQRLLRKKKHKFTLKMLILVILCGDGLFLTGFIGHRLYTNWREHNETIYPVEFEEKQRISPTEIPWIKTEEECLRTNRVWEDDQCLDNEWSHLF